MHITLKKNKFKDNPKYLNLTLCLLKSDLFHIKYL